MSLSVTCLISVRKLCMSVYSTLKIPVPNLTRRREIYRLLLRRERLLFCKWLPRVERVRGGGLNTAGYHPSVSGASDLSVALCPEDREVSVVGRGDIASYRNNLMRYARVNTV